VVCNLLLSTIFFNLQIAKVGVVQEKKEVDFDLDSSVHSSRSRHSDAGSATSSANNSASSPNVKITTPNNLLDTLASNSYLKKLIQVDDTIAVKVHHIEGMLNIRQLGVRR
jgi:hypothetical protein